MIPIASDLVDFVQETVTEDPETGNDVKAWTVSRSNVPASVQPVSSTENQTLNDTYRQEVTTYYAVFVDGDSGLSELDRISWKGQTLEVNGLPMYRPMIGYTRITAARVSG